MLPLFIIKRNLPHYKLKTELSFMARPKRSRLKELTFISSGVGLPPGDTTYKWIQNHQWTENCPYSRNEKWQTWGFGREGKSHSVASCGMFTFLHGKGWLPNITVFCWFVCLFFSQKPSWVFAQLLFKKSLAFTHDLSSMSLGSWEGCSNILNAIKELNSAWWHSLCFPSNSSCSHISLRRQDPF